MFKIEDSVEIEADPEEIEEWIRNTDKHYRGLHPDHVKWENLSDTFDVGSIIRAEEYIQGKLHSITYRITRMERNGIFVMEYKGRKWADRLMGVGGSLTVLPMEGGGCLVTATSSFRFGWLMRILDYLTGLPTAVKRHMEEEGMNMKRMLEERGETS